MKLNTYLLKEKLENVPTPEQMILFLDSQLPDISGEWEYDSHGKTIIHKLPNINFYFDTIHNVVEVCREDLIKRNTVRLNEDENYVVYINRERDSRGFIMLYRNITSNDHYLQTLEVFPASIENQIHVCDFKFNVLHTDEATGKQINEFLEKVGL